MEINLAKKHFATIAALCIVFAAGFALAYNYTNPLPNPGHGGDTIWVDVPGSGEMDLQNAITAGLFGGGGATYDSGWFAISNGQYQTLTHGLGTTSIINSIYAADDSSGTNMTTVSYATREADSSARYGGSVQTINSNTFRFHTGSHGYRIYSNTGVNIQKNWIWARVVATGKSSAALPICADGQILKYNFASSTWECADESGGGSLAFGSWQNTDIGQVGGTGLPLAKDTVYTSSSDGFVVAYGNSYNTIRIESPNGTTRCKIVLGHGNDMTGNMCPIRKGDTWKIWSNVAGALTIYWIPLTEGGGASLPICADGQILKYNFASSTWECADESGGAAFGDWVDVTSSASGGAVQGPVTSDGFVVAYTIQSNNLGMYGETPAGVRKSYNHQNWWEDRVDITMPVKKGDTWKVVAQQANVAGPYLEKVWWIPLIEGGGGSSYEQVDCSWVESPYCGARAAHGWTDVKCPDGKFVAGIGLRGCTGNGASGAFCDDDSRCEKTRVYCCG